MELVPLQLFDLAVKLADKDRPILCGAIAARADYLLTGDKQDFRHLFGRTISGVKIVSVQLLLADLICRSTKTVRHRGARLRYDKLAQTFFGFACLAATLVYLLW